MSESPAKFIREVRQEVGKVTWPSRRETMISTAMVLILVFIAAVFFYVVDSVISFGVRTILGLGV
jgi:preprotein translocase subunit SecE